MVFGQALGFVSDTSESWLTIIIHLFGLRMRTLEEIDASIMEKWILLLFTCISLVATDIFVVIRSEKDVFSWSNNRTDCNIFSGGTATAYAGVIVRGGITCICNNGSATFSTEYNRCLSYENESK